MRSLNSVRNAVVSIFYELMLVAFGLIIPRLIIETYGSDVNGLASSVNNVLQVLTLLQAGAAGASIFQMFKPVADKDYDRVSVIMDATRKFFFKIGTVFIILVILTTPAFGFLVKSESVTVAEKCVAFLILGLNGAMYMFFTSYFDVLFSSHQKRFVLSFASIAEKLVYYGLIILIIALKLNFMFMYLAVGAGTVVKIFILYAVYLKTYKPLIKKVPKPNLFKIPNRGYLLIDQVAVQIITSLPVVAVSFMDGLSVASVFSVYYLVYTMIKMVINTMQLSVAEVFGNFVVSKGEEDVKRVFNLLEFVFTLSGAFLCACTAFLYMPFIYVYTDGNAMDVNYMYSALAALNVALIIFYCAAQPYYTLTNVYGYYKQTYKEAAICAVIGVALSVGLGLIYWPLVVAGPVLFYIVSFIYRMRVAKKFLKWVTVKKSVFRIFVVIILSAAGFLASRFIYAGGYADSWLIWLLHAVLCAAAAMVLLCIYIFAAERKEAKDLGAYLKALFKNKKRRNKSEG